MNLKKINDNNYEEFETKLKDIKKWEDEINKLDEIYNIGDLKTKTKLEVKNEINDIKNYIKENDLNPFLKNRLNKNLDKLEELSNIKNPKISQRAKNVVYYLKNTLKKNKLLTTTVLAAAIVLPIVLIGNDNQDKYEKCLLLIEHMKENIQAWDIKNDLANECVDKLNCEEKENLPDKEGREKCYDLINNAIRREQSPNTPENVGSDNVVEKNKEGDIVQISGVDPDDYNKEETGKQYTLKNKCIIEERGITNEEDTETIVKAKSEILNKLNKCGIYPGYKWNGGDNVKDDDGECKELLNKYIIDKEECWMMVGQKNINIEETAPKDKDYKSDKIVQPTIKLKDENECNDDIECKDYIKKYKEEGFKPKPPVTNDVWTKIWEKLKEIWENNQQIIILIIILLIISQLIGGKKSKHRGYGYPPPPGYYPPPPGYYPPPPGY